MLAMEHFGTRLKLFRETRGWSQEQLGFELEVSKAAVSKWEAGRAQPRLENLTEIRRLVGQDGLTLDYLVDGADGTENTRQARQQRSRTVRNTDEATLLARFRAMKPSRRKGLLELLLE